MNERKNLISALIKAQAEIKAPSKNAANSFYRKGDGTPFMYATLDDIYQAVKPVLSRNGLTLSHSVERDDHQGYYLLTTLYHESGESICNKFPMIIEKQTNQSIGAARTYACRYATCNLLAIPQEDDDDGNATLNPQQVKAFEDTIGNDDVLAHHVLKSYERKYKKPVKSFADIKQADFVPAIERLKTNPKPIQRN